MKKLFFILILATTSLVQAQTFYNNKLLLFADEQGAEFDFSNSSPFDSIYFKVVDASGNTILDIGSYLQNAVQNYNGTYFFSNINTLSPSLTVPNYSFTMGQQYYVDYYLPSSFTFKLYNHNPYQWFNVNLYLLDSDDNIMGRYNMAHISYNRELYIGQYWLCFGQNSWGHEHNYNWLFNFSHVVPTTLDYEDMYYDNPPLYRSSVAKCVLGISFASV